MNRKAFTLIELLVVVAIIGILAAVGVVAYNGYTASAKKQTTLINFKFVTNYISHEVKKCDLLGAKKAMDDELNCNPNGVVTSGAASAAAIRTLRGKKKLKNAYDSKDFLVDSGNIYNKDEYVGRIHLIPKETSPGTNLYNILVTTCYQTPCNDTINHKEQEISFYD